MGVDAMTTTTNCGVGGGRRTEQSASEATRALRVSQSHSEVAAVCVDDALLVDWIPGFRVDSFDWIAAADTASVAADSAADSVDIAAAADTGAESARVACACAWRPRQPQHRSPHRAAHSDRRRWRAPQCRDWAGAARQSEPKLRATMRMMTTMLTMGRLRMKMRGRQWPMRTRSARHRKG